MQNCVLFIYLFIFKKAILLDIEYVIVFGGEEEESLLECLQSWINMGEMPHPESFDLSSWLPGEAP
jgi:hypothetical protein